MSVENASSTDYRCNFLSEVRTGSFTDDTQCDLMCPISVDELNISFCFRLHSIRSAIRSLRLLTEYGSFEFRDIESQMHCQRWRCGRKPSTDRIIGTDISATSFHSSLLPTIGDVANGLTHLPQALSHTNINFGMKWTSGARATKRW
jgi:hypothetical protein